MRGAPPRRFQKRSTSVQRVLMKDPRINALGNSGCARTKMRRLLYIFVIRQRFPYATFAELRMKRSPGLLGGNCLGEQGVSLPRERRRRC